MPIHDQGYRRYDGRRTIGRGWRVIARTGIQQRIRERRFLALLLFSWIPFVIRGVQIYAAATFPQASFLAPTPGTFREFLDQQAIFVFFVTIYAGAGLIAADRRVNALQIYLSKPLTRVEYVAGKLTTLVAFLAMVTWLPALLLLLLQLMFAGSLTFLRANLYLIPAITVFAVLQISTSAVVILALSSLSNNSRFVGVLFAGMVFFSEAVSRTLRAITGAEGWVLLSPRDTLNVIADAVFRDGASPVVPVPAAMGVTVLLMVAAIWILERRVRGVEVVI